MRIAITGARGQLGRSLCEVFADHDRIELCRPDFDLAASDTCNRVIDQSPELVIHAAAMTQVDRCAEDPETALRVNRDGTAQIARACGALDIPLVYVSTNEVFDGAASAPYAEDAEPRPINAYAASKHAGEQAAAEHARRLFIVRTAWVFAPGGVNFPSKMIELADRHGRLKVVDDEIANPTYAPDLARAIARLVRTDRYGTYHFTNDGYCSRHAFAVEILKQAGREQVPVLPISSREFQRASTPPAFTPLLNRNGAALGITLRPWPEALKDYLNHE